MLSTRHCPNPYSLVYMSRGEKKSKVHTGTETHSTFQSFERKVVVSK